MLVTVLESVRRALIPLTFTVSVVCEGPEHAKLCVNGPAEQMSLELGLLEANKPHHSWKRSQKSLLAFLHGWSSLLVLLGGGCGGAEFAGTHPAVSVQV